MIIRVIFSPYHLPPTYRNSSRDFIKVNYCFFKSFSGYRLIVKCGAIYTFTTIFLIRDFVRKVCWPYNKIIVLITSCEQLFQHLDLLFFSCEQSFLFSGVMFYLLIFSWITSNILGIFYVTTRIFINFWCILSKVLCAILHENNVYKLFSNFPHFFGNFSMFFSFLENNYLFSIFIQYYENKLIINFIKIPDRNLIRILIDISMFEHYGR